MNRLVAIAALGLIAYLVASLVILWMIRDSVAAWNSFAKSLPPRPRDLGSDVEVGTGPGYIGATKFRFVSATAGPAGVLVKKHIFPFSVVLSPFLVPWSHIASMELIPNKLTIDGHGEVDAVLWLQNRTDSICLPWRTELNRHVPDTVALEDSTDTEVSI